MPVAIRRIAVATLFALTACAGGGTVQAQDGVHQAGDVSFRTVTVVAGLNHPWAVAFLPDGRMLVTERSGALRMVRADGTLSPDPVSGTPEVVAQGQGGLLDVVLHPEFEDNRWVYLTYSMARERGGQSTAVARAKLEGDRLVDLETIFAAQNISTGTGHYGSRMAFAPDGKLYVTVGERQDPDRAQERSNHFGTVVRLNPDGSVPDDNPFLGRDGILPEIYTWGHRNPQGMAVHPETGEVWVNEHGPRGGDEVNKLDPGANYGWPVVTHGVAYSGLPMGEGASKPGMEDPLHHWTPSIAPSGMIFYTGDAFPAWRGDAFVGALSHRLIMRVTFDGTRFVSEEKLLEREYGRIRDVAQGPDGAIWFLTDEDNGRLVRMEPAG